MFDPTALHGIIPPMCTPFTDDGEIDVPSVHNLIEHLLAGGVHGIFALGSTGEFASLTGQQRAAMLKIVVEAVRGRVPVLAGILETSTSRCIENGLAAKEAGVDAVVLAPIYYFRASQLEIIDHFRAVHEDAVSTPVSFIVVHISRWRGHRKGQKQRRWRNSPTDSPGRRPSRPPRQADPLAPWECGSAVAA